MRNPISSRKKSFQNLFARFWVFATAGVNRVHFFFLLAAPGIDETHARIARKRNHIHFLSRAVERDHDHGIRARFVFIDEVSAHHSAEFGIENFGFHPTAVFADQQQIDAVIAHVIEKQIGVLLHRHQRIFRLHDIFRDVAAIGRERAVSQPAARDDERGKAKPAPKLALAAWLRRGCGRGLDDGLVLSSGQR